jgi:hypothetical protein
MSMKGIRSIVFAVTAALIAGSAFAQGRHDEKPHGMMKPSPAATERSGPAGTGGRHDEGPTSHGKKKAPAKKTDAPAAEGTAVSK